MGQGNYDEWRKVARSPDVVRAMIEDDRAGLNVDRQHDDADRTAGNCLHGQEAPDATSRRGSARCASIIGNLVPDAG